MNPADRAQDPRRVIDLSATRRIKEITDQVIPIPLTSQEESPEMTKHVDEALEMGNPDPKKKKYKLIAGPGFMGEDK